MSLTIQLPPKIATLLRKKAARKGLAAGDYVRTLIEREVAPLRLSSKSPRTLQNIRHGKQRSTPGWKATGISLLQPCPWKRCDARISTRTALNGIPA